MALITAEEFKKNKGQTVSSSTSPSTGLITAEEFKKQKAQERTDAVMNTVSSVQSAASAIGDYFRGVGDSIRQGAKERLAQQSQQNAAAAKNFADTQTLIGLTRTQPETPPIEKPMIARMNESIAQNRQSQEEQMRERLRAGEVSISDVARVPNETLGGNLQRVGESLQRFDTGLQDALTFGITSALDRRIAESANSLELREMMQERLAGLDSPEAKVGGFVGTTLGGAGAYGLIGNLGRSIAQPLLRTGVRGAAAGALYGAAGEAADIALDTRQDGVNTIGQRLGNVALEAALGGALDVGLETVGKGVIEALKQLRNRKGAPVEAIDEILALPEPRQRGRANTAVTPDVIEAGMPATRATIRRTETPSESVSGTSDTNIPIRSEMPSMANTDRLTAVEPSSSQTLTSEFEKIIEEATQPRIRDKVYTFFDEAERAARERIASRRNRLSANPVDEWADYAVIMASKVVKGTIKLADFTEELVKEFGEGIRPYANQILRRTQQEIRKQTGRASKEVEDVVRFNSGGGDANTFRAKIDRNPKRSKKSFSEIWERARTHFSDDVAALESAEKRVKGYIPSAEDSLYKMARLFKGAPSKAHLIVQDRFAPIAKKVEQAGFTMEDLGDYALAMHARDVNANYMKSGFTNAEIKAVIDKYQNTPLEEARQELVKISNDMLNELADAQVISRETVDYLTQKWPNYMPLFRSFDDDLVEFESGLSNALANVSDPIKKLKGSERKVIDPIENMVRNIFKTVNAAERNRVALQLARMSDHPNAEGIVRRLGDKEEVGRKNVVTVRENGQRVRYEVEPNVYKAMLNLDKESSNMLINILSKPASILRAGATLTPEFSLRNPMRDIVQAYVVSNSGFNPLIDFPIGLIETIKGRKGNSELYRQWVNDLGDYGNIFSMDRKVHREALEKVFKQPAGKKFVNIINGKSLLGLLRMISDTTESATKLGEYRAALRQGASRQEAAYRSRDIMDFARAGSSIRQANKIIAFFNANIQGKSKLLRALKENPVGVTTRAFTAVTLPTVAAFILQKYMSNDTQRETIDEAPDWMKDTFWLIPVPGTDVVARIPKPFDLSPIFSNLPERTLEYVYNEDKEAFDGFVRRSMGDMAIPIQITGLWPFIEGISNYSFFRDAPIIPRREEGLDWRDQYDPVRTSETAKVLARGAELLTGGEGMFKNFSSPRVMENTIRGLTAGLGTYVTDAIDWIVRGTGVTNRPQAPEKRLEQQPLVKAFTVDPMQSSKTLDKFYRMKENLSNSRNSARINERPFTKEHQYQVLNTASGTISDINTMIRSIEASDLSAKEKRERIEQLQKQRLEIARQALQIVERAQ